MRVRLFLVLGSSAIGTCLAAQPVPPARALGPITAVSAPGELGAVSMVRALSTGAVLVNDVTRRQLVLFDKNLVKRKVIADSTIETGKSYGSALGGLLAFSGDTSLFVDPTTLSMLVIDPNGEVARVMSVPSTKDVQSMIGGPFGTPALDMKGRIVCRTVLKPQPLVVMSGKSAAKSTLSVQTDDSALIYRIDIRTRATDSLTYVRIPSESRSLSVDERDNRTLHIRRNPLPVVDDWAVMSDGRVAIVRGADFHVEWFGLDGSAVSTPRVPFPWERLSDEAKERLVDSLQADASRRRRERESQLRSNPGSTPRSTDGFEASLPIVVVNGYMQSEGPPRVPGRRETIMDPPSVKLLPDYRPAFRIGSARGDAEGNLWVRTTTPSDAGAIYAVISPNGTLIDRVKVPFGRVIAGFAAGTVYLGVLDGKGARLERASVR